MRQSTTRAEPVGDTFQRNANLFAFESNLIWCDKIFYYNLKRLSAAILWQALNRQHNRTTLRPIFLHGVRFWNSFSFEIWTHSNYSRMKISLPWLESYWRSIRILRCEVRTTVLVNEALIGCQANWLWVTTDIMIFHNFENQMQIHTDFMIYCQWCKLEFIFQH